jgi:hypothetical protein
MRRGNGSDDLGCEMERVTLLKVSTYLSLELRINYHILNKQVVASKYKLV